VLVEVIERFLKCDENICLKLILVLKLGVLVLSRVSVKFYSKYCLNFTHELIKCIK